MNTTNRKAKSVCNVPQDELAGNVLFIVRSMESIDLVVATEERMALIDRDESLTFLSSYVLRVA